MMTRNRWVLWAAPALLLSLPIVSSFAQDAGHDDVRKKLAEIRKQINDLRDKEKALLEQEQKFLKLKAELEREAKLKEAERKVKEHAELLKREIAEKAKHQIKVEIRGKLVRAMGPFSPATMYLHINELHWPLSFQDAKGLNKTLVAECEKHVNKHVVVTGSITTKMASNWYRGGYAPGHPWEDDLRQRDWNGWNPYTPPVLINPTVIVESIKLAP